MLSQYLQMISFANYENVDLDFDAVNIWKTDWFQSMTLISCCKVVVRRMCWCKLVWLQNMSLPLLQTMPRKLHVSYGYRRQSKLWVHEFWQLWLGSSVCLSSYDPGLLGKSVHACKFYVCFKYLLNYLFFVTITVFLWKKHVIYDVWLNVFCNMQAFAIY